MDPMTDRLQEAGHTASDAFAPQRDSRNHYGKLESRRKRETVVPMTRPEMRAAALDTCAGGAAYRGTPWVCALARDAKAKGGSVGGRSSRTSRRGVVILDRRALREGRPSGGIGCRGRAARRGTRGPAGRIRAECA